MGVKDARSKKMAQVETNMATYVWFIVSYLNYYKQ